MPLFLVCNFILLWHCHSIIIGYVLHIFMIPIQRWPLTSRSDLTVFWHGFVFGHSFCVLWHNHTIFGTWVYHHEIMCHMHSWSLYGLDLWPQYPNYIFTMNLCFGKIVFALWHRHTKFDMSGYIIMKKSTCCVHSWSLYHLQLFGVAGVSVISFTHSFYLVGLIVACLFICVL